MKPPQYPAPISKWLSEPMTPDVARALDRLALTEDVVRLAVLPDVHLAKEVCVGVALASNARLFPDAVGGDIGCGMAAIRFHCDGAALTHRKTVARLLSRLYEEVPITKHRVGKAACPEGESLKGAILSHPTLEKRLARDGALQLGSLGRGNHFLEFQVDQDDALWAMVHSGSRAMGQAIRAHHLKTATRSSSGLMSISAESTEGEAYLNDVGWALDYAAANRAAMIAAVSGILFDELRVDPDADSFVSCHHNFVAREEIGGRLLWVHRKGVISARQDEPGLVPGSMGTSSFHVVGRGSEDSLCSSSHGAGRAMSRGEARRRISVRALEKQMAHVWFDQRMAARLVDEAPSAYKDISAVMRAQRDLTRIIRELRPVLTFKGG